MTTVSQRPVDFFSDGLRIRGTLFSPSSCSSPAKKHPIVVFGHGFGGLKEWAIPETAEALAQAGIAGLSFDYRNFGDSEGMPREEVSHLGRLQNWQDAITYALSLPETDAQRLGIWGTSLGGRDALAIAAVDKRVKSVLAQAPLIYWTESSAARMAGYDDDLVGFRSDLAKDRMNKMRGDEPQYVHFVRGSGDDIKQSFIESLTMGERRSFYNRITLQSYSPTVLMDVSSLISRISPVPVRFVFAEDDTLPGQVWAYELAKEPKSLIKIKGHHFSPYMESKSKAIEAARDWFIDTLVVRDAV
ncbi:hypothetical protein M409DRAFT_30537 [Zasmidium cellare ATCC 36951]|uniref:AB hydrolase-1 domain-containing protein n=1 Tax=Zasmidium cellare ATCC 36951 TaxID=1080233 RepID=A0A6A6BW24_ZASCE|nr:uncharacterized protein M409DRAFT_30537 [Zasmidium cellare ATCC 36951]KAF2159001.1 hypothetical protein M409DRAFT_30537 [Zasmidium cellare ATCC 36951]